VKTFLEKLDTFMGEFTNDVVVGVEIVFKLPLALIALIIGFPFWIIGKTLGKRE
jgi:hypothetical protein